LLLWLALAVGLFFAVNIGASGTAAAMGAAYGAGAVRRKVALLLCALCAFTGSVMAGQGVAVTIGKGLLPAGTLPGECAVIILASACLTLFVANVIGIPLSTSEVTVGAVVGTAMVLGQPPVGKIALIVGTWVLIPLLSFFVAYLLQRSFAQVLRPYLHKRRRLLATLLTMGGCYEAFAAGANNVANAVGPLIGAGLIAMNLGIVAGGIGLAFGAITLGARVLNTNAKKITALDLLSGTMVSFTGATLVVGASLFGIPTPLTQVTTMGIIGVGYANGGTAALNPVTLRRLAAVWLVSPVLSTAVSYLGTTFLTSVGRPAPFTTLWVVLAAAGAVMVGRYLLRQPRVAPATPALVGEEESLLEDAGQWK
jgi:sulfate permease